jgi:hypothetical protein
VSAQVYDGFLTGFAQRAVDWVQDSFKVVLVSGDYQPDTVAHRTRADLEGFELGTVPGYDRGGMRLRSRLVEAADPSGVMLAAGDVVWDGFTGAFRYAVVCQDNGGRSQDLLVSVADMGDQTVENARVVSAYSADGVCLFAPEED